MDDEKHFYNKDKIYWGEWDLLQIFVTEIKD